nr:putative serine/threonine-protein kinase-like protein CCR3 [Ipomoea batatas]
MGNKPKRFQEKESAFKSELRRKSVVYGLKVVLQELLTEKRAIFKNGNGSVALMSVVEYAVPAIMAGELEKILDGELEKILDGELGGRRRWWKRRL